MTHTQVPGVAAQPAPLLNERDNQRAVDLIESAERAAPYCPCGSHMIAVAHGEEIWLECAARSEPKGGFSGLVAKVMTLGHTRRVIMELHSSE